MELQRLVGVLGRNALRIVIFAAIVGVAVGAASSYMPKTYQASTQLVVAGSMLGDPPKIDEIQAAARMAQTLAELATTRPILSAALAKVGDPTTPADFRQQVDVRAAQDSLFIAITVRAADARSSAALANALASQLISEAPGLMGATSAAVKAPVSIVEAALPPDSPTSPRVLMNGLLAVAAAAFAAIVVAILADYRKSRTPVQPPAAATPSWPERPSPSFYAAPAPRAWVERPSPPIRAVPAAPAASVQPDPPPLPKANRANSPRPRKQGT